ncbi:hypothetical protein [Nocardia sp. NPDC057030]|uniref:hypothetical protein n=1 Tax=unclassified Nocardia TaxID=2637762 RepID=UPI00362E9527
MRSQGPDDWRRRAILEYKYENIVRLLFGGIMAFAGMFAAVLINAVVPNKVEASPITQAFLWIAFVSGAFSLMYVCLQYLLVNRRSNAALRRIDDENEALREGEED